MSTDTPDPATQEELRDTLAILVDGHRPRTKRIFKARTEDGLVDVEIVATRGRWAVALLPTGKLVTIGKLARLG